MSRTIEHNVAASRFEWTEDGILCVLDYELQNDAMIITHTGVPQPVGGRGIAGDLAQAALDTARANGWSVRPLCSYVDAWIRRHPEYQDLVAN
ncbi:GNAT family N-acetyltransferase [Allopusillimonas ginsengisoli]|uniref:GNAT family N-acetyltransferase n=1 Tax=Allopusillimonas ginsengisoli TaxID=453575 RepID=UPI00101F046F|nr:GNAT family N-acetyltransferase [Allopusillimonas ginsengisoli]TEA78489.1 N-acetyltransferase [Allopusillimonas ginsengisoli]